MKKYLLTLFLSTITCITNGFAQTEDYYGPVTISFHGFICNRPTNDDPLGRDGVGDEVLVEFWNWTSVATNRANYNGLSKIYGEDFFLPFRVKAGTATINGGLKAGDSYYREGVYGDGDPNILSNYAIINTFCSQNTLIVILPTIWEKDEGPLGITPLQDFGVATNRALNDMAIKQKFWEFRDSYVYDDNNPYGYFVAGRYIGLDAKYEGMFTANKNKLAIRPVGLFPNWDFSSQVLILTPKTIKIIAEKDYGYGKGIIPVAFNEETLENTFGHGNYTLLLRVVADIKLREQPPPPTPPAQHRVALEADSVKPGERLRFYIDGFNTITVTEGKKPFYFPKTIAKGVRFRVAQEGGIGTFEIVPNYYTVGDSDILVKVKRIIPPTMHTIGVKVNALEEGEQFEYSLGPNKQITITEADKITYFPGTFSTGESYTVTQLSGPRACELTPNTGQIAHSDVVINAICGTSTMKTHLRGKFSAPPGTKLVLQYNQKDSLVLKQAGTSGNWALQTTDFNFPKKYPVDESYMITIKSEPASLGCKVYANGEGQVAEPNESNFIGVRCDYSHDLVSRSTDNKILNTYYESFTPVTGGMNEDEGRYAAFVAYGKGMDGSTGNYRQVFWRDRKTGETRLISKSASGEEANGNNHVPAISADGKTVAFESYATNLSATDNNGARDIYVWQGQTGKISLVSKSQFGEAANSESMDPTVSGDGTIIAYSSNASNLDPNSKGGVNVFVHDLLSGTTELISKDYETGKGVGGSVPSISEDGTKVVFCSFSYRLTQNDNNNLWDIFLWERSSPRLRRISFTESGTERNQGTESSSRQVAPSISGDGRFVAYATTASNMVQGDDNEMQDVFICSTSGGFVKRISKAGTTDTNGDSPISQGEKIGISYDGRWITYNTNADNLGVPKGNIVLQNTQTGQIIPVTNFTNGSTARPMISRNGSYVIAGCSEKYDKRFNTSGIFIFFPRSN